MAVNAISEPAIGTPSYYSDKGTATSFKADWTPSLATWMVSYPYGIIEIFFLTQPQITFDY